MIALSYAISWAAGIFATAALVMTHHPVFGGTVLFLTCCVRITSRGASV